MKIKQFVVPALFIVVGAILLSFLLTGLARDYIILPLTKLFWLAKGLYVSIPQSLCWGSLLVVVIFTFGFIMLYSDWSRPNERKHHPVHPGEVEMLAVCIARTRKRILSRWQLARRLGEISLELIKNLGTRDSEPRSLEGTGWNPPPSIQAYLETGLRTGYADYARDSAKLHKPSLSIDVNLVVEYLESLMEYEHDQSNHGNF